ncbi:MAG: hypothetical protein ACPLRP_07385 [Candidatus Bipolaricaulaceae bacterium]
MRGAIIMALSLAFFGLAQSPTYLWATLSPPEEAWIALPERAQTLSIPIARFSPETGVLSFVGAKNEEELRQSNAFLFLDGDFFLLAIREGEWTTILRGKAQAAELVLLGPGAPENLSSFALLQALGLLPSGMVELVQKEIPGKPPAPPEGTKLDPILWALVSHPDWFGFAKAQGIERVGIRVRVVAELAAPLPQEWEPFIRSSTDPLAELLIPIPLLPELGRDPAVKLVRPPYEPVPLGG